MIRRLVLPECLFPGRLLFYEEYMDVNDLLAQLLTAASTRAAADKTTFLEQPVLVDFGRIRFAVTSMELLESGLVLGVQPQSVTK